MIMKFQPETDDAAFAEKVIEGNKKIVIKLISEIEGGFDAEDSLDDIMTFFKENLDEIMGQMASP
jgi:hypothetical protein